MVTKYRAAPTVYGGVKYASKAEAARAAELDLLLKAGEIVDWIGQPTVRLGVPENVYRPDFLVIGLDSYVGAMRDASLKAGPGLGVPRDRITRPDKALLGAWYEDVKGAETAKFKRDKKLWRAYGRLPLHIIRGGQTVEVIQPEGTK